MSLNKDYPQAFQQSQAKGQAGKWKIRHTGGGRSSVPAHNGTETKRDNKVKVLESPVFVPFTRVSTLRKALQKVDDTLGECMNTPGVKFVEQ